MKAKKGLSVLLSLSMLFSLLPTMAFAADSEEMDASTITVEAPTTEGTEAEPGNEEKDEANSAPIQTNDTVGAPTDDSSDLGAAQDSDTTEYISFDEAKYIPGAYVKDKDGLHHRRIGTDFDFIENDVAYSYVTDENGNEVTVSPWDWYYACDNGCNESGHTSVVPHTLYSGYKSGITIAATVKHSDKTYNVVGVDVGTFAHVSNSVVTLPEGIQTIGMEAFYNYRPGGEQAFQVPASVTEIGDACFGACGVPITFAEGSQLKTVGEEAFYNLNLPNAELVLPNGVETLGDSVFSRSTLKLVTIPGTVTNLSSSVLSSYTGTIKFTNGPANFQLADGVLYGYGKLIEVRNKEATSITVPDDITEIAPQAFMGLKSLTSITLPEGLTTIGYGAFANCTALTSITLPASVTELPAPTSPNQVSEGLLSGCKSLKSVEIKGDITAIPANTFYNCSVLEQVTLPESITELGKGAFQNCTALKTISLPNVEILGQSAFQASGLTEVKDFNNLKTIEKTAFNLCKSLETVVLPDGVTELPQAAFANCSALKTVVLPASMSKIGPSVFQSSLTSENSTILMMGNAPEVDEKMFSTKDGNKPEGLTVYYPAAAEDAYRETVLVGEDDNGGYALNLTDASMILTTAKAADGNTLTLKTVTVPEGMTLTATSSDNTIATVDTTNGLVVTGIKEGTATITATLKVGDYVVLEDTCTVTVTAEGEVAPAVEEPEIIVGDSIIENDKETANKVASSVATDDVIRSAAEDAANSLSNSFEKESLIEKGKEELEPGENGEVFLYTQTYLSIEATKLTEKDGGITSITLNITPVMRVVASTADDSESVDLAEGFGNAVVVKEAEALKIHGNSEITVTLPDNFAKHTVYVKHEADSGTYFYKAEANAQGILTFTSTHGFSPFTFSLTNEAVAEVNDIGYASFQAAVDATGDNGTVKVLDANAALNATISGSSKTIYVENGTAKKITVTINGTTKTIAQNESETFTYTHSSSSGTTHYSVEVRGTTGGTVTASPTRAAKGATVTLTVRADEGCQLDGLTVTDSKGGTVKLTDKGSGTYTFTMPASKVTVQASFTQNQSGTLPFTDVKTGDWFYEAVQYVYDKGMMTGVSADRFAPASTTTRGMIVTILYRLENEPAVSGELPFTDVEAGTWYADAVAWAAANDIVNGTSATTFAPNSPITREQMATMLYRFAQYKGMDAVTLQEHLTGYPDGDQVSDYAIPAMNWAVGQGLIAGMENGTLVPQGSATRAQVATILMRFCESIG